MEFNPNNKVIQRCMQGMAKEKEGKPKDASKLFIQAWNEATNDFERFTAAFYVARHQNSIPDKLKWLETGLRLALNINSDAVKGALPSLYSNIAKCYQDIGDLDNAKKNNELAMSFKDIPTDKGPFYTEQKRIYRLAIY